MKRRFFSLRNIVLMLILCAIEQGSKVFIYFVMDEYMGKTVDIGPLFAFSPFFNIDGSWLNSAFGIGYNRWLTVFFSIFMLGLLVLMYYVMEFCADEINSRIRFRNIALIGFCGVLCSIIDRVVWTYSLDFINVKFMGFTCDIKDIYLTLFVIGGVSVCVVQSAYEWKRTKRLLSLKDEMDYVRRVINYIKSY